jgi:hypothetical protein
MLYYCGKPACRGHQLFSQACTERPTAKPAPYKPSRQLYDYFDLPTTNGRKVQIARPALTR